MSLQFGDCADAGAVWYQDDGRGVLEDHTEDDIVGALDRVHQNARCANAEICLARRDCGARVYIWTAFSNFDLEAVLAIKPLLDGGVVARKLKLVLPFELKGHAIKCAGRRDK